MHAEMDEFDDDPRRPLVVLTKEEDSPREMAEVAGEAKSNGATCNGGAKGEKEENAYEVISEEAVRHQHGNRARKWQKGSAGARRTRATWAGEFSIRRSTRLSARYTWVCCWVGYEKNLLLMYKNMHACVHLISKVYYCRNQKRGPAATG